MLRIVLYPDAKPIGDFDVDKVADMLQAQLEKGEEVEHWTSTSLLIGEIRARIGEGKIPADKVEIIDGLTFTVNPNGSMDIFPPNLDKKCDDILMRLMGTIHPTPNRAPEPA